MASRQAPRSSQPLLLYGSNPVPNAHVKLPSVELMADYPSPYRRRPLPSLPFAGHDRITSIFPLRKRPEPELPSLETPDTTFAHIPKRSPSQAALEESTKRRKSSRLDLSGYALTTSSRSYLALKDELIHPLNTNDAAIKETYDATTIARDVLIAANQHPTERGLNQHLIVLRKNFPAVNFSSDLETFRWDIIDPEPFKPPKPSISTMPTTSCPHGSETSMERRSSSRLRHLSETKSIRSTSPGSSTPSTPCPVQQPMKHSLSHPNRVTKPSSGRTALRTPKGSSPPRRSPYFNRTPEPQVVVSTSPDHKGAPVKTPVSRTPTHTNRVTKPFSIQPARKTPKPVSLSKIPPDPKSLRQSPHHPAIVEKTQKTKKPVVESRHAFQCRWVNCQRILSDRDSLRSHIMKEHIVSSLICGWDTCDCKLPLAAVPLWHHVLDVHVPEIKSGSGKGS